MAAVALPPAGFAGTWRRIAALLLLFPPLVPACECPVLFSHCKTSSGWCYFDDTYTERCDDNGVSAQGRACQSITLARRDARGEAAGGGVRSALLRAALSPVGLFRSDSRFRRNAHRRSLHPRRVQTHRGC